MLIEWEVSPAASSPRLSASVAAVDSVLPRFPLRTRHGWLFVGSLTAKVSMFNSSLKHGANRFHDHYRTVALTDMRKSSDEPLYLLVFLAASFLPEDGHSYFEPCRRASTSPHGPSAPLQ